MTFYTNDFQAGITAQQYDGAYTAGYPGYDPSLTVGIEETINPLGLGIMTTPADSGETCVVYSTNAGDIGHLIVLECLDGDGLAVLGFAYLNGTTPMVVQDGANPATSNDLVISRVNSVINRSNSQFPSPPSQLNTAGDVLCRNLADTITYNGFTAEDQRSFCLIFTVPSNKMGWFLPAESTINKAGGQDTSVIMRTKTRIAGGPWLNNGRWGLQRDGTSAFLFETFDRPYIPPFTDIMVTAEASSTGTDVTGRIPIWVAPAEYYKG